MLSKHFFRRPRTTQELRRNSDRLELQFSRAKRCKRRLPNAWDDIAIGRQHWPRRNHSWKLLRKTQYRCI
jgi:hypothetical protein